MAVLSTYLTDVQGSISDDGKSLRAVSGCREIALGRNRKPFLLGELDNGHQQLTVLPIPDLDTVMGAGRDAFAVSQKGDRSNAARMSKNAMLSCWLIVGCAKRMKARLRCKVVDIIRWF